MYEIERKFLVNTEKLPNKWDKVEKIKQTYIFSEDKGNMRIRQKGDDYILTIKLKDIGIKIIEIEKRLSKEEFDLLWSKTTHKISKTRKIIDRWEVDFFHNLNKPFDDLVLAEIELNEENEDFELPSWIIEEVTHKDMYFNANLIKWSK